VITGLKVMIPVIPRDRAFKKSLRDELMKDNPYAAHWVDSVIGKAYTVMKPWRKMYLRRRLGRLSRGLGGGSLGAR
jgi:putative transposase